MASEQTTTDNADSANRSRVSRRRALSALGATGIAALAGCSGGGGTGSGATAGNSGGGSESYTIQIGSTYEPDHILVRSAKQFKKKLETQTDGRISVNIIPGGSLGSEEAIINAVQSGSIQGQVGGGIPVSMFASDYYFVDTPFIIKDWEHFKSVWNSDAFQPALKSIREKGNQRNLGVIYRGIRHYTAKKPVRTPEDVQGMKLRLPQLDDWVKIWNRIGVNPTPVALNELYSALQQGVAAASEGPAQQVYTSSLYEVQSHYNLTSHMVQTGGLYINEGFYQDLSSGDQELVTTAADEATTWASDKAQSEEEQLITKLEKEGMKIVRDADSEAFRQAGMPAVKELFENKYAASWDEIKNA